MSIFEIAVDNLPVDYGNETNVSRYFMQCGSIKKIKLIPPKDSKHKRSRAYIQFFSYEACKNALQLNNTSFGGNILNIILLNKQPKSTPYPKSKPHFQFLKSQPQPQQKPQPQPQSVPIYSPLNHPHFQFLQPQPQPKTQPIFTPLHYVSQIPSNITESYPSRPQSQIIFTNPHQLMTYQTQPYQSHYTKPSVKKNKEHKKSELQSSNIVDVILLYLGIKTDSHQRRDKNANEIVVSLLIILREENNIEVKKINEVAEQLEKAVTSNTNKLKVLDQTIKKLELSKIPCKLLIKQKDEIENEIRQLKNKLVFKRSEKWGLKVRIFHENIGVESLSLRIRDTLKRLKKNNPKNQTDIKSIEQELVQCKKMINRLLCQNIDFIHRDRIDFDRLEHYLDTNIVSIESTLGIETFDWNVLSYIYETNIAIAHDHLIDYA